MKLLILSLIQTMKSTGFIMLTNTFRIIGGKWRGRRLPFPANTAIRPTLDHIRETLFNWLQPVISGARCLDAFAGSGALGLEALSRGAAHVTFIDQDAPTLQHIQQHLQQLDINAYDSFKLSLPRDLLRLNHAPYDVIFLDPPFHSDLLDGTLDTLHNSPFITTDTLIYVETPATHHFFEQHWNIYRQKKTKNIAYGLLQKA